MTTAVIEREEILAKRLAPTKPINRAVHQLIYVAPFLLLAVITWGFNGFASLGDNSNSAVLTIVRNLAEQDFIGYEIISMYPSVAMTLGGIANVFPTSFALLFLAVVGSLAASSLLVTLSDLLRQKQIGAGWRIVLIMALFGNPVIYYDAFYNTVGMVALAFFGFGVIHCVRFIQWGSTHSGFVAGLYFAGAMLCSDDSVLYVLLGIFATVTFSWIYKGHRGSTLGVITVLVYPTILAMATLAFLSVVLHRSFTFFLTPAVMEDELSGTKVISSEAGSQFIQWIQMNSLNGWGLVATVIPLIFLVLIAMGWKQKMWAFAAAGIIMAAELASQFWDPSMLPNGSAFLMVSILSLITISEERSKLNNVSIVVGCVLMVVAGWFLTLNRPETITLWWNQVIAYIF